jgi:hypothetical protein
VCGLNADIRDIPVAPEDRVTPADRVAVGTAVAALTTGEPTGRADRGRQLARLAVALTRSARSAGVAAVVGGRWLVDLFVDVAPRLPVRDREALAAAYPGLDPDQLADALISTAARTAAALGAAAGAAAAVEWTAPPTLLASAPGLLAAQTLTIASVEFRLVAELHAAYGLPAAGGPRERAAAYLWAWTTRRAVDGRPPDWRLGDTLRGAPLALLRRRLGGRVGRHLPSLGPLLSGAVAGGVVNAREVRRLGEALRADLRTRSPYLR